MFFFLSRKEAGRHALYDDYAVIVVIKQRVYKRTICSRRSSNSFNFELKVELSPWTYINLSNFIAENEYETRMDFIGHGSFLPLMFGRRIYDRSEEYRQKTYNGNTKGITER